MAGDGDVASDDDRDAIDGVGENMGVDGMTGDAAVGVCGNV